MGVNDRRRKLLRTTSSGRTAPAFDFSVFPPPAAHSFRGGFTLIELLTVIALIGVLIALLLPAVQQSRESARSTQCKNQLKQIALAAANYESARGALPPAGDVELGVGLAPYRGLPSDPKFEVFKQTEGRQIGWAVYLLPYLEEQSLADQFDLQRPLFLQSGAPQATRVELLMCPSDLASPTPFSHGALTLNRPVAKGNYAAFCSPFHLDLQNLAPGAISGGGRRMSEITDGLSHTMAFSEVRTRDDPLDERGAWALPWNGASLLAFDMHSDKKCFPFVAYGGPSIAGQTQRPNSQGPNQDVLQICSSPANAQLLEMPCFDYHETGNEYLSSAPRSQHPGGVNAASMDGSVQFLLNEVDAYLMAYMISINDGESTGDAVGYVPSLNGACGYKILDSAPTIPTPK